MNPLQGLLSQIGQLMGQPQQQQPQAPVGQQGGQLSGQLLSGAGPAMGQMAPQPPVDPFMQQLDALRQLIAQHSAAWNTQQMPGGGQNMGFQLGPIQGNMGSNPNRQSYGGSLGVVNGPGLGYTGRQGHLPSIHAGNNGDY